MSKKLDRLNPSNSSGTPFVKLWQKNCEAIETQFTDIFSALASMSEVAPISVDADYTGAVNPAGQLPYQVAIKRYNGDVDVTASTAWSEAATGGITASIGAATGILSVTALTASGTITVTSTYSGITKTRLVPVTLNIGAVPSTGSGGAGTTTSSGTTFNSINSATHAAISDELTVTVGASGTVDLNASLKVRTAKTNPTGDFPVYGIWRWWNGAAYADVGTEVQTSPDCDLEFDTVFDLTPGTLTVNNSKTGLAAASSQKFQLYARNSSGTRAMTFSGTASAVP